MLTLQPVFFILTYINYTFSNDFTKKYSIIKIDIGIQLFYDPKIVN